MRRRPTDRRRGVALLAVAFSLVLIAGPIVQAGISISADSRRHAQSGITPLEPNDEFDTATNITLPFDRSDLETSFDDTDIYAVSLQPGDQVTVSLRFSHANGDIDVFIADPYHDLINQSTSITDNESTSFRAGIAGTYFIVVEGWAESTTPYALTVTGTDGELPTNDQFEYNDGFATATAIPPSFDRAELRIAGGEYDYYAVTVPDNTRLNVTARFNATVSDIDIRIYNGTETLLGTGFSAFGNETATVAVEDGGTYYLEVFSRNDASAWYHLSVTTEPLPPDDTSPTTASTTSTTEGSSTTTTGDAGPGFTLVLTVVILSLLATVTAVRA